MTKDTADATDATDARAREEILDWMESGLFHFSFKTVNSNIPAGGVRVGVDKALDLPYISVRSLLAEGHSTKLDYLSNSGKDATYFKLLRHALGEVEKPDPRISIDPSFANTMREKYCEISSNQKEKNTSNVSPRLRQMLIPKDGGYVAITPLGSSGLCSDVEDIVKKRKAMASDKSGENAYIGFDKKISQLSVGGSNPQNVGGRVRSMWHPLVFENIPASNLPDFKLALNIFKKGFNPRLPLALVVDYYNYLESFKDNPASKHNMKSKEIEASKVKLLLDAISRQAERAENLLSRYEYLFSNMEDSSEQSIIDDSLNIWVQPNFENRDKRLDSLLSKLSGYKLKNINGDAMKLILSEDDRSRLISIMGQIA